MNYHEATIPMGHSPRCRSCGSNIVWVRMESGRMMPCDPPLIYGDDEATLVVLLVNDYGVEYGKTFAKACDELLGRVSHFATCANAKKHRKGKQAGNVHAWKQ